MRSTSSVYGYGIVSPKSRRLRTVAALLLVAIVLLGAYGMRVVMPGVNQAAERASFQHFTGAQQTTHTDKTPRLHITPRENRVLRFKLLVAYGYWSAWTVLVLSLLLVTWLDLREVVRNYAAQRKTLFQSAINGTQRPSRFVEEPLAGGAEPAALEKAPSDLPGTGSVAQRPDGNRSGGV